MKTLNRRNLLALAGLSTLSAAACSNGSSTSGTGSNTGTGSSTTSPAKGGGNASGSLTWWSYKEPQIPLTKKMAKKWGKAPVKVTFIENSKIAQSLQLAKQSHQLPDVFTPHSLDLSLKQLVTDDWYQPLQWDADFLKKAFPANTLFEGIHLLEGKPYTFPIISWQYFFDQLFFNADLLKKAGLDSGNPPTTYDEFRSACQTVQKKTDAAAWIWHIKQAPRIGNDMNMFAQSGGFPGSQGMLFKTGEYKFEHEAYANALEFLLGLQKDKLLLPGSNTLNARQARGRWAAGSAAFFFDGPWCPGIVVKDFNEFTDKMGVGPMIVPDQGETPTTYHGIRGGVYVISGQSKHAAQASALLKLFTTPDYYKLWAGLMVEPPLDTSVISQAKVNPIWTKYIQIGKPNAFLAPSATARDPEAITAYSAHTKAVHPNLGEVIGGLFSGQLTDVTAELKKLSGRHEKARETAIKAAKKASPNVTLDANVWAFPDWAPRQSYGADHYKQ